MKSLVARFLYEGVPAVARHTLHLLPHRLTTHCVRPALAKVLAQPVAEGELDFLEGYIVALKLTDLDFVLLITLQDGTLQLLDTGTPDVTLSACSPDLVLIAARKVDPDTLFFQRRLQIEGDTELGLAVKNLLDGQDLSMLPDMVNKLLEMSGQSLLWARHHRSAMAQSPGVPH